MKARSRRWQQLIHSPLTPVVDGTGPTPPAGNVYGHTTEALIDWLDAGERAFRDRTEVVTIEGYAGYFTATASAVPAVRTAMDPLQVVHLAADNPALCRQQVQQDTTRYRGRVGEVDALRPPQRLLEEFMGQAPLLSWYSWVLGPDSR